MNPSAREEYRALLRRQRDLTRDYERLLDKLHEEGESATLLPTCIGWPTPPVYVERRCALDRDIDGNMHLVTLPGQRAVGLKELRDFTSQVESLIIVDQYMFSGDGGTASAIAEDFKRTARIAGKRLNRVHFIYDPSHATKAICDEIAKQLAQHKVHMSERHTNIVHDRLWIADRSRALVIGTSFNGIGSRAAFLIPLPHPDLNSVLEYLDENALSRAEA